MAKYTIKYACGHGSHVEQLFGKTSERERRIEWEEKNRSCPECYKAQLLEADEKAEPRASVSVVCNGVGAYLRTEVVGRTNHHKEALLALDIKRREARGSFMSIFASKAQWFCGKEVPVKSISELREKLDETLEALEELGYAVTRATDSSNMDEALAVEWFKRKELELVAAEAAKKEREELAKTDPRPPNSSLRNRIAELEKDASSKWNGKIYGMRGNRNFYVDNVQHSATDAEVAEREENLKLHTAWKARNP